MRSTRPRLMESGVMNVWTRVIIAGGLALAGGWLWISEGTAVEAGVPMRTKARLVPRAGNPVLQTTGDCPQSSAVRKAAVIFLSPEGFRTHAEAARAVVSPSLREEMTRRAVQEWAAQDAVAAIEWAAGLSDANESRMAMQQICARLADDDPSAAIRLAMDHELDGGPGDFIGGLAGAWAGRDLDAAREWVESQPQGELRDGLMGAIVFELAKTDPLEAARLVAEKMGGGEPQMEAAVSVIHQWASRDPRAAAAWVDSFPEGDLKERGRRELFAVKAGG